MKVYTGKLGGKYVLKNGRKVYLPSKFSRNSLKYPVKQIRKVRPVSYPWKECIKDQMKQYNNMSIAKKVCGSIRAKSLKKGSKMLSNRRSRYSKFGNPRVDVVHFNNPSDNTRVQLYWNPPSSRLLP